MKTFKMILENVQTMNSDKEVKLNDYKDKLKNYNSNKSKLISVLTRPTEQWEIEAGKIIKDNIYLGGQWKYDKMNFKITDDTKKLQGNELTQDEKNNLQKDININKQELVKIKQTLDTQIKDDLIALQKL